MGITQDGLGKSSQMWKEGCRIGLRGPRGSRLDRRSEDGAPGKTGNLSRPNPHPRKGKSGCEELNQEGGDGSEGRGKLGQGSDSWVRESTLNRNHWKTFRIFHGKKAFLNMVFENHVSLCCYKLDLWQALSGFPIMGLLSLLKVCLSIRLFCLLLLDS